MEENKVEGKELYQGFLILWSGSVQAADEKRAADFKHSLFVRLVSHEEIEIYEIK